MNQQPIALPSGLRGRSVSPPEKPAALDTERLRAKLADDAGRNSEQAAEALVNATVAEALAAPELVELRAKRDRMAARVTEYREARARLGSEADQTAAASKAAILAGDDRKADELEANLAKLKTEAQKILTRLPDLRAAHSELVKEVEAAEARAGRLACRRKLPTASAGLAKIRAARERLEAEFAAKLAVAVEAESIARAAARALLGAATMMYTVVRDGEKVLRDANADEAQAAGLKPLTEDDLDALR